MLGAFCFKAFMFFCSLFRSSVLPKSERRLLSQLEKKLAYRFKDLLLLKRALSHKSYVNERRESQDEHNERLEFLGDAVLELGISGLLMHHFPDSREGEMSKVRASLVNETALSEVARAFSLGRFLFLGRGEEQCDGREKNSLLADAFEAMLGAVYLDGGFNPAFKIVKRLFEPLIILATKEDINRDYKTKLQEEVQNAFRTSPQYQLVNETGPDHDKTFEIHLLISGQKVGVGFGKSKKQAEQEAAEGVLGRFEEIAKTLNTKL